MDDLDGVSSKSATPVYDPGPQYRVKEMDPDESGGGKDFYDGFMRQSKQKKEGETPEGEKPGKPEPNPLPVVERESIHDDVVLSAKARSLMEHPDLGGKPAPPLAGGNNPRRTEPAPHIQIQA